MAWWKSKKKLKEARHKSRNSRKLDKFMREAGINPDLAICTECGQEYSLRNHAAVDYHAH